MVSCEICGKPASLTAIVEGAELEVCNNCAKYGKVKEAPRHVTFQEFRQEKEFEIIQGYGNLIQTKRLELGLSREELAKKLNLKESTLKNYEDGRFKPTQIDVEKLEAILKIKLLTEIQQEKTQKKKISGSLTIGDVIIIKDKRK